MERRDGPADAGGKRPARADARRNRRRILEAAGDVFAESGASASTQAVAARAGVAIGTVFRHFPTKPELLEAVVMNVWEQLVAEVDELVADPQAESALVELCSRAMAVSADNRAVVVRLSETGTRVHVGDALARLEPSVAVLLQRAQAAGEVRDDLRPDELIAMLGAICQGAITGGWSAPFRRRVLDLLVDGIRPPGPRGPATGDPRASGP